MTRKKKKGSSGSGGGGGGLFCGCFSKFDEPPEIEYDMNMGVATMTSPSSAQLPPPDELKAAFAQFVDELEMPTQQRQRMFDLPPEKQWQLLCNKQKEQDDPNKLATSWPDYYIDRLSSISTIMVLVYDDEAIETRLKLVDGLKSALRTQPVRFAIRFTELDGVSCIINFLLNMVPEVRESRVHTSAIGCIKALMNNAQGRASVLAHPDAINVIAQSLNCDSLRTKISVLEILGAMCLVPGGHKKVLESMMHFQSYNNERTRFQYIVNELALRSSSANHPDESFQLDLKTAVMSFLNALISCGPGQDHLEFRCHLRYELLLLGIQPLMEELRIKFDNDVLNRHLDFFQLVRREDEEEIASRFDEKHVDTKNAVEMFDLIRGKLSTTEAYHHFLSLLHHFMYLPLNRSGSPYHWQLIDRIVQQITIQKLDGADPDIEFLRNFKVEKCVKLLIDEHEMRKMKEMSEQMRKKHDEIRAQLDRKERECETKMKEKEELMKSVNILKKKLDVETKSNKQLRQQVDDVTRQADVLRDNLQTMKDQQEQQEKQQQQTCVVVNGVADEPQSTMMAQQVLTVEQTEKKKLQNLLLTSSSSSSALTVTSQPSDGEHATTHQQQQQPSSTPTIPPPPPMVPPPPPVFNIPIPPPVPGGIPPPPGLIPPPPPPSAASAVAKPPKKIPKPKNPLKSFNWSKLPESKLDGTIWNKLDESKIYKQIDLEELDSTFSAYQRQQENHQIIKKYDGSQEDISSKKPKELTVIDGRRAQNCTILLSKLKMTNTEMRRAILSCDESEYLQKDMLEQLIKFIPTKEETDLLNEHRHEVKRMARADRFLFEMSQIFHYGQRLHALFYKKKFHERISELQPKVEVLLTASSEVGESKKLRKVLEVILALGNYMNKGTRGNAYGFKLQSLNKIVDTKSSTNRSVTLMNFLLQILEKEVYGETIKLPQDLQHVEGAARVSLGELEKDLALLRVGLNNLKKEIAVMTTSLPNNGDITMTTNDDRFVDVMSDFVTVASLSFTQVDEMLTSAKSKYKEVVTSFGEDPNKLQPDEFFQLFHQFIESFNVARKENVEIKQKKLEEEKRKKIEQQQAELKKRRMSSSKSRSKSHHGGAADNNRGEFDDLVSALRSAEVFDKDVHKFQKRNRQRRGGGGGSTSVDSRERVVTKITTNC